jgi:protein-S-isoprenylcysteine O-methyltransferase Ste14
MTDDEPMTADECERAFQVYSKIAEQIKKEDDLVNQRLTWGATINGALLALLGVGGGLFKDSLQHSLIFVIIFCGIAILLSVIAVLVCWETIQGIKGARTQINYIRSAL